MEEVDKQHKRVLCHECNLPILAVELGGVTNIKGEEGWFHSHCILIHSQLTSGDVADKGNQSPTPDGK